MDETLSTAKRSHKVSLSNRKICNLTGISDVLSFDVNEVILETDQGMLMIKGKDLHVTRLSLDKGEVDIDGRIDSLTYSEQVGTGAKSESILSRLFR